MKLLMSLLLIIQHQIIAEALGGTSPSIVDRWANEVTTSFTTANFSSALQYLNDAIVHYGALRGDVVGLLQQAIELDPGLMMAHIYLGHIFLLSTAVTSTDPTVQSSYRAAKLLANEGKANERELIYLKAFEALLDGNFAEAAKQWEVAIDRNPRDVLAIRSAHDAYIILGNVKNLRASIARVLGRWDLDNETYAQGRAEDANQDKRLVNAMWSFALEEAGDLHRAAEVAEAVLKEDPTDVTSLHALAHTFGEHGQSLEGEEAVYQQFEGKWEEGNLLNHHLAWHRALFLINLDQFEKALELYDRFLGKDGGKVGPPTPLAMSDASSLLWRLELQGVDIGGRWHKLRPCYEPYEKAHVSTFNDFHMMLCLASADPAAAQEALNGMHQFASSPATLTPSALIDLYNRTFPPTNQHVLRTTGLSVCEALLAFKQGRYSETVDLLQQSSEHWQMIGGSHAQRDVLALTLIEASIRGGEWVVARRLLAERAALKDLANEEKVWDRLKWAEGKIREEGRTGSCISSKL